MISNWLCLFSVLLMSYSIVAQEQKKSIYLDESVPFEKRIKKLEQECTPLMRKRGPSVNKLYKAKLEQVKQVGLTAEEQKTALMPVLGLCMGVGVKL